MRSCTTPRHTLCRAILSAGLWLAAAPAGAQRAPGAEADASPSTILVRGVVRTPGGRHVPKAIVRVTQHLGTLIGMTTSDADGRFVIAAPNRQLVSVTIDAPLRRAAYGRPFVTTDMGEIIATLGGSRPTIDTVRGPRIEPVAGRLVDTANAVAMTRTAEGTWVANLTSDRESLRYRVRYGRGSDTNVPAAGRIVSVADDSDLPDFVSVAPVTNGVATITVDPASLPTDTIDSQLRVSNRASTAARLDVVDELSRALQSVAAAAQKGDTAAARRAQDSVARVGVRRFDAERDPIVRQALANTLLLTFWPQLSVDEARRLRRTLDPRSPVATYYGYPINLAGALLAEEFPTLRGLAVASDTTFARRSRELLQSALATPGISAWTRSRLYWTLASTLGRDASSQSLGLAYADSLAAMPESSEQEVRMLMRYIAPSRPTQVGKSIVPWVVADLDDPTRQHRASDFAGKWTLIDLWGPWCAPCVAEMPVLHEAHRVFSARGLHIVSIDFDRSPEAARAFRKERYPMPWTNGYAGDGMFESPAARAFSTAAFPTIILVNPEGRIVAMDVDLRGARLAQTLDRLLPAAGQSQP